MKKIFALSLLVMLFLAPGCSPKQNVTPDTPINKPKSLSWTMTGLLKDWLITPHDLVINGQEIYVSGNLDKRVAVLNLNGQILRYYTLEKNLQFDNVCVAVTSKGQVLAISAYGLWELKPDGTVGKIKSHSLNISHMIVGPDDNLYVATRPQDKTTILKMGLDGATSDLVTVDSNRISDLEFDLNGNLFMADGQYGRILKYSQKQGIEIFSNGFIGTAGSGPFYLAFDQAGRLYTSSVENSLALVSAAGTVIPLEFINISGDLVFHDGLLYTIDIYTSKLFEINIDYTTILSKQILLDGFVPWYIDHQGENMVIGQRGTLAGQVFFNYDITQPGRVESNPLLNTLQPDQYIYDDSGILICFFAGCSRSWTRQAEKNIAFRFPVIFNGISLYSIILRTAKSTILTKTQIV